MPVYLWPRWIASCIESPTAFLACGVNGGVLVGWTSQKSLPLAAGPTPPT